MTERRSVAFSFCNGLFGLIILLHSACAAPTSFFPSFVQWEAVFSDPTSPGKGRPREREGGARNDPFLQPFPVDLSLDLLRRGGESPLRPPGALAFQSARSCCSFFSAALSKTSGNAAGGNQERNFRTGGALTFLERDGLCRGRSSRSTSKEQSSPKMGLLELLPLYTYGLALATVLALWALCVFCRRKRRPGEPPLINGWLPFLGEALKFRNDATKLLLSLQQKYGDVFTIHIAGRYITFLMNPLQFVSLTKNSKYLDFRELANQISSQAFGHTSILNQNWPDMNENVHRAYQYLLGKPLDVLSDNMMKNLQCLFEKRFSQATDWEMEKMHKFCFSLIFEASFVTLYGRDPIADGYSVTDAVGDKFKKFDANFSYLATNVPIELLGATKRIRKELISMFLPKNMARWLGTSEVVQYRKDVFDMYELLGDYDKAAHHFAFMWASVGNTIPATFWAMYYLLRHPKALAVVRDEIDHLLQSTGQERRPGYHIRLTREQLDNLVYLESAINESFRLCSSSSNIRIAKEDFILKLEENQEVNLRKGDWVAIYPPVLHMDPEVYEVPKKYKFDRFIEDGKKKTTFYKHGRKLKYFLMPFGSGISKCPGRFFAVNEIKLFLVLLLTYFDGEIMEEKQVGLDKSRMSLGILMPDTDIAFRYRPRS
ncbi:cytochrome P450 7B1 [Rhineura floridana]|uniref:cytochrome P450 7B1 n=1 Tax=Rhineura floridana TaxID=261503 RepID=UPI002AC8636C|nr:cytochrome P450 7B1 [Rhineura floridana]